MIYMLYVIYISSSWFEMIYSLLFILLYYVIVESKSYGVFVYFAINLIKLFRIRKNILMAKNYLRE